jgi:hypothetical protein
MVIFGSVIFHMSFTRTITFAEPSITALEFPDNIHAIPHPSDW